MDRKIDDTAYNSFGLKRNDSSWGELVESQVQDGFDKGAALEKYNLWSIDLVVGKKIEGQVGKNEVLGSGTFVSVVVSAEKSEDVKNKTRNFHIVIVG